VTDVAALYIDPRGPYPKLLGPERCWDEKRDARTYDGPWPVVAHPPCGPWGRLKHLSRQPRELGPIAVDQVRRFGGVLEHPAGSALWRHCGLPLPGEPPDSWGGHTIKVNQVEWGHACVKPTWVYQVGLRLSPAEPPFPGRKPTHGIWYGDFERAGRAGPRLRGASKEIRRRTPPAFAEWLINLAAQARRPT
jgi:hypothetical protein